MKKEKVIKATNVGELFHHYANSTFDKDKRSDYSYEGDFFYIGNTVFAKIISKKKKIVVVQPFNRSGGYGSGYSVQSLKNSFNQDWTVIQYERIIHLPNKLEDYTKEDFLKIALYNLKEAVLSKVNTYVLDKYLIKDKTVFARINQWSRSTAFETTLNLYTTKFKVSKSAILNHIYNDIHYTTVEYIGWGKQVQERYKVDKPIKFYLDSTKWHTKEEQAILDFKEWKHKYFNLSVSVNRYGKTYKEVYDNPELKTEFEARADKLVIQHQATILYIQQLREAEELAKSQERLDSWLDGKDAYSLYNIPIHLRIKDGRIETTRNAIIPFESGKKLFKLFNKIRQDSTILIYSAQPDEVSVGHYNFRNIEHIDEHWYVTVGCHKIRDTEIDLFINSNNLQDWL